MNPSELKFFNTNSSDYPILAATEAEGMYFNLYGNPYSDTPRVDHGIFYQRKTGYLKTFKEVTLSMVLPRFFSEDIRQKFLKTLKIANPDIKITEEDKNKIISKLRNSRAFNEDSAMNMEEFNICYFLKEQKVIKEFGGRFYIGKDLKNIKDLRDIPTIPLTQGVLNV
jgi:hypothetical protein